MAILIVGFQRSGTTLTRRIFHYHPEVQQALHEKWVLNKGGNRKVVLGYLKEQGVNPEEPWGEKIPFFGGKPAPLISYAKRFQDYFPSSHIVHVVRHPMDVARSVVKRHSAASLIGCLDFWKGFTPGAARWTLDNGGVVFRYEDLLLHTDEVVQRLFEHCGLNSSPEVVREATAPGPRWKTTEPKQDHIVGSRAYAHRQDAALIDPELDRLYTTIPVSFQV